MKANCKLSYCFSLSLALIYYNAMDLDIIKLQEDCSDSFIRCSARFSYNDRGDLWSIASHHHGKLSNTNKEPRIL
jgi:hypothetical protein